MTERLAENAVSRIKSEDPVVFQDQDEVVRRAVGMMTHYESRGLGELHEDYWWVRRRAEVVRLIRRQRGALQGVRVVTELGCGTGPDGLLLAKAFDGRLAGYHSTDFNPMDLDVCRLRHRHAGYDAGSYEQVDLTHPLPWADGSLEFIYSAEVFEHLYDVEPLIQEIARVLRPGGFLLFTTPNEPNVLQRSFWSRRRRAQIEERIKEEGHAVPGGNFANGHVGLKPCREWDRLMRHNGFTLVDAGRGAIWYRPGRLAGLRATLALQLVAESLIDLLPRRWMRWLSDGQIALYQRDLGKRARFRS